MRDKVLIVDDQPGIRLLLTDVFTTEGYEVTVAKDGKEALEKIYDHSFDLIMLDYHLPFLSGSEILEEMTRDKMVIPVILMSGLTENIREELLKGSMEIKLVSKPFNIKEICELAELMIL